jgi:hypothetical protein
MVYGGEHGLKNTKVGMGVVRSLKYPFLSFVILCNCMVWDSFYFSYNLPSLEDL